MKHLSFLLFPAGNLCGGEVYNCLGEVKFRTPFGEDIQVNVMACCVSNKFAIPNLLELVKGAFSRQMRSSESLGILAWTGWCVEKLDASPLICKVEVPAFVLSAVNSELCLHIQPDEAIFISGLYEDYLKYRNSLM